MAECQIWSMDNFQPNTFDVGCSTHEWESRGNTRRKDATDALEAHLAEYAQA